MLPRLASGMRPRSALRPSPSSFASRICVAAASARNLASSNPALSSQRFALVARPPALMRDGANARALFGHAIDEQIRVAPKREDQTPIARSATQARGSIDEPCSAFELIEKRSSNPQARMLDVPVEDLLEFLGSLRREEVAHADRARRRATTASPTSQADLPDEIAASRRSTSSAHSLSQEGSSGSGSKLASRRSSNCERSSGDRASTSAANTSIGIDMDNLGSPSVTGIIALPKRGRPRTRRTRGRVRAHGPGGSRLRAVAPRE